MEKQSHQNYKNLNYFLFLHRIGEIASEIWFIWFIWFISFVWFAGLAGDWVGFGALIGAILLVGCQDLCISFLQECQLFRSASERLTVYLSPDCTTMSAVCLLSEARNHENEDA